MEKKKLVLLIGCIVFGIFILLVLLSQENLTRHGVLLNAHTLNWAASSNMGMNLQFEFYYNKEKKIGGNSFSKIRGLRDFEDKYFPVMYDPKLGASQLLIEPSEFERFDLPFPDSLKWVLKYLQK